MIVIKYRSIRNIRSIIEADKTNEIRQSKYNFTYAVY